MSFREYVQSFYEVILTLWNGFVELLPKTEFVRLESLQKYRDIGYLRDINNNYNHSYISDKQTYLLDKNTEKLTLSGN